jgi:hypothetical protein
MTAEIRHSVSGLCLLMRETGIHRRLVGEFSLKVSVFSGDKQGENRCMKRIIHPSCTI